MPLSEVIAALLRVMFVLNLICGFAIVFLEKKNPSVTWAWLMVLALVPYFGFVLYLLMGQDSRKSYTFAQKAKRDDAAYERAIHSNIEGLAFMAAQRRFDNPKQFLRIPGAEYLNDLAHLNFVSGHGAFTSNNQVALYHEGVSKFRALFTDIANAKHFIHMQYYIMNNDGLGRRVIQALAARAREGVEVCLLVDGMGCWKTPKRFYKPLTEAGGHVAIFLPPHLARVNYRNHRKICVVDGSIGYVGGLNIGDEYVGENKRFGFWRDTHIRIEGNAVKDLELRFAMDWNECAKHFKLTPDDMHYPALPHREGGSLIQIVSSGPDTPRSSIYYGYAKMIAEADKSIYIQTPYFAPDDNIFEALRIAALSGLDVRIIIPAHPDHFFVYWASLSYLGELLKAGVRCYQYENGFIHSKLILIDGITASTGTANMDVRSFKLNFEINAFIYDRGITGAFETAFLKDLDDCMEMTNEWYAKRGNLTRIRESVSRLLSPLL